MSDLATTELWSIFDARRVKQPELRGLDLVVNGFVGWVKNRRPILAQLKEAAERVSALEKETHDLGATRFKEAVVEARDQARVGKLKDAALDRGLALAREAAWRTIGKRPFDVEI